MRQQREAVVYTREQVRAALRGIGVEIATETSHDFVCYCPFHGNRDTPSFSVSSSRGLYWCFNPSCGASGDLLSLIRRLTKRNEFEARRFLAKKDSETQQAFQERLAEALTPKERVTFPQAVIDRLKQAFPGSPGEEYMRNRGFEDETLDYFDIGYSANQNMVTTPVHWPDGVPAGQVGRSVIPGDKSFKNSQNLPRSKTMFNIHRAKRIGDRVIICESAFDAMRIHQAGFPNVIAILGGHISPDNYNLLDRTFETIVIFTDNDKPEDYKRKGCGKCKGRGGCVGHPPGREIGINLAGALPNKMLYWASFDERVIYPHGAKDACDMTDDEIRQCIMRAVSYPEYISWTLDN